jgi:hypothetical protein
MKKIAAECLSIKTVNTVSAIDNRCISEITSIGDGFKKVVTDVKGFHIIEAISDIEALVP